MQARKATKKDKTNLSQGTIFSIRNLELVIDGNRESLSRIYPFVNFSKIKHAVVLTQSCDLVHDRVLEKNGVTIEKGSRPEKYDVRVPKVPHITFCLLEPIEVFIEKFTKLSKKDFSLTLDEYVKGISDDFTVEILSKEKALEKIQAELDKLFQNNHPWAFFISLPPKSSKKYYFVNLTKILPIKMAHYETILSKAGFNLSTEFCDKLAWKLSYLYGRVGTKDYSRAEIKKISADILSIAEKNIFKLSKKFKDIDAKNFGELKSVLNSLKGTEAEKVSKAITALKKHIPGL
jgi:hypothetical protein